MSGTRTGYWRQDWAPPGSDGPPHTIYENPLLDTMLQHMSSYSASCSFMEELPLSWQAPTASWRRMLVTQPPFVGIVSVYPTVCAEASVHVLDMEECRMGNVATQLSKQWYLLPTIPRRCEINGWQQWKILEKNEQLESLRTSANDQDAEFEAGVVELDCGQPGIPKP